MYNYRQLPGFMTPERWQEIERLYQEALKCEPRERAGLLALADPDLRDEVERLLEQSVGTPNLILGGAGTQTGQYAIDARGDAINPAAGQQIGNYLLQEQLGAGGMGIVFRAEDLKLRRSVALKFLPPHLTSDPRQRAQLLREARAASKLDHVNIGTIYGIEETEDG